VIFMPIDAPNVLCAQLTRDLFAIVEFSFNSFVTIRYTLYAVTLMAMALGPFNCI